MNRALAAVLLCTPRLRLEEGRWIRIRAPNECGCTLREAAHEVSVRTERPVDLLFGRLHVAPCDGPAVLDWLRAQLPLLLDVVRPHLPPLPPGTRLLACDERCRRAEGRTCAVVSRGVVSHFSRRTPSALRCAALFDLHVTELRSIRCSQPDLKALTTAHAIRPRRLAVLLLDEEAGHRRDAWHVALPKYLSLHDLT